MRVVAMLPNGRGGLYRGRLTIAADRITEVAPHPAGRSASHDDIDFSPHVALPGFIDLQLNGAFGHDITSSPETLWTIGEQLPRHGVTAFLPTVITSEAHRRQAAYAALRALPDGYAGATPLGLHIEGPALSPSRAGAHPRALLINDAAPLADELTDLADAVTLVTIAPETANVTRSIERLTAAGIAVSLGHTEATAAQTVEALEAGASAFTHLFNGMGPIHHRELGAAGTALLHASAYVSVIADGHHLADDMIRLIWRLAGPGRTILITDAMAGTGAEAGAHRIGDVAVNCDDAPRDNHGHLAGALLTMPDAARRTRRVTGATWDELAAVTSSNQADLLSDAERGRLDPGRRADISVVDSQLRPVATFVAGELAWQRSEAAIVARTATKTRRGSSAHASVPAAIGVDIGGTTFKAAIFDGAALGPVRRGATGNDRPAAEVLAEVRDTIDELAAATRLELRGAGIACAGIVDPVSGTAVRGAGLGWNDIDVLAAVRGDHGLPVALEHDVYLAALAEWGTGSGVGAGSMLYVSVGTGVASRLVTGHGIERGHNNLAGEMGFMPAGDGARWLESVASGRAMSDAYRRMAGRSLTVEQIVVAAEHGDPAAVQVWSEAMDALAHGITAAVCLQDPEVVVVGGGVSTAGQVLLDDINPRITALMEALREPPPMVLAAHGANSGIIGAALLGSGDLQFRLEPDVRAGPA